MKEILTQIVHNRELHKKWLNTLSFMENTGARKISACEDPFKVDIVQLKHAVEEHRHAYYLKKQIRKLEIEDYGHYHPSELLASVYTRQYLHQLDIRCSKYLKQHFGLAGKELKYGSYLFVTYAIELRADKLYPVYQEVLTEQQSKVMVRSIIVEEEGHLEEMTNMLEQFDENWREHAFRIEKMETHLFEEWFGKLSQEVSAYEYPGVAMA